MYLAYLSNLACVCVLAHVCVCGVYVCVLCLMCVFFMYVCIHVCACVFVCIVRALSRQPDTLKRTLMALLSRCLLARLSRFYVRS